MTLLGNSRRPHGLRVFITLALVAVTCASALGCVSRKQYAINEAILISERRQLEDEIYRVQFELRDALEENERLQEQLDRQEGDDAAREKSKTTRKTRARQSDAAPATQYQDAFPGDDYLQTSPQSRSSRHYAPAYAEPVSSGQDEQVETLPDFVPIPVTQRNSNSSDASARSAQTSDRVVPGRVANADYRSNNAKPQNRVAQTAYQESENPESENCQYDQAEDQDQDLDDWSPIS